MQCIAHMWSSPDCEGENQFALCLSPTDSTEGGAPTESFANEEALSLRLTDVGFDTSSVSLNLCRLRRRETLAWSNTEVPSEVFEHFGK
ncbi:hypothetical protein [Granulicella sp. dw_53]|uniref:hypothetical protein n=1 Tax=Granulicella sp. dw_53 TaxID=2719792 RepID=UPI001BD3AE1D|nr:hypothetical protein [Granulicella sp. dw_53]